MTIEGANYRLTRHGRRRFIERVGKKPDLEIIRECVGDPCAVWKPDYSGDGFRLVTYLASREVRS